MKKKIKRKFPLLRPTSEEMSKIERDLESVTASPVGENPENNKDELSEAEKKLLSKVI